MKIGVFVVVSTPRVEVSVINLHQDIVSKCLGGDRKSHEQLYRLYAKAMYNVAYRIVKDEDEAEDVLQDSFVSAFSRLSSYNGESTFGAWLKRIVINRSINLLRKRRLEFTELNEEINPHDEPTDPFSSETGPEIAVVKRCIAKLPDGYRVVLSLYMLEGYDHAEIAEILGITESTSKSQLNRAKSKLKELIYEEYGK